jgi:hypothetical protein
MTFVGYQHHVESASRSCIVPPHSPDSGANPQESTDVTPGLKPTKIGRGPLRSIPRTSCAHISMERGDPGLARRTSTGAFLKREPSSVLSEGCPCDSMIRKVPSRKSDGRARPDAKRHRLDRTGPCVQGALDIAREQNNLIIGDMVLHFHAFVSQMFDAEEKKPGSTSRWDFLN